MAEHFDIFHYLFCTWTTSIGVAIKDKDNKNFFKKCNTVYP